MNPPEPEDKHPAKRRPLRGLVTGVLLAGLFIALHAYQTRGVARGPAPEFQGRLLGGEPVSMQDFRGRPVLLHFWATWCPVCGLQEGSVESIAQDYPVVTIASWSEGEAAVKKYMHDNGLTFPVMLDDSGQLARSFGLKGVPASFILSPSGEIAYVETGYTTEAGLRLRLWLSTVIE